METGTSRDDAGTQFGHFLENLRFGLVDVFGGDVDTELLGEFGIYAQCLGRRQGFDEADDIGQPALLLSLEFLDAAGCKVELLLQGLDEILVAVTGIQFFGQDAAYGVSSGADFAAEGNDKVFFRVHREVA